MNRIVSEKAKLNEREFPQLKMSNRDEFVPSPRPDTLASKAQQPRQLHALRKTIRETHKRGIWRRGGIVAPIGEGEVKWRRVLVCLLLSTPLFHLKESSVFMRVRKRSNRQEVVARVVAKQAVAGE